VSDISQVCIRSISNQAQTLLELSDALEMVGNEILSEKLYYISSQLSKAATMLHDEEGKAIGEQMERMNESSANMLNACLAGVKLGRGDK